MAVMRVIALRDNARVDILASSCRQLVAASSQVAIGRLSCSSLEGELAPGHLPGVFFRLSLRGARMRDEAISPK
jgi:hypothetical protein